MTKTVVTSAYQDQLMHIANFGDRMTICRLAPLNYAEAVLTVTQNTSGVALMQSALTTSLGLGTYSSQVGLVSGRRVHVATQATMTVSETANANHLAIVSTVRSALLLVTTLTSQAVTAGNQATASSFNLEIRDPT